MASSHPLRPYYIPPSPPPFSQPSSSNPSAPSTYNSSLYTTTSIKHSTKPEIISSSNTNYDSGISLFDVSPLIGSGIIAFLGTGLVMPLEVAKTLLQVGKFSQGSHPSSSSPQQIGVGSSGGDVSSLEGIQIEEEDDDEYFSNPNHSSLTRNSSHPTPPSPFSPSSHHRPRQTNHRNVSNSTNSTFNKPSSSIGSNTTVGGTVILKDKQGNGRKEWELQIESVKNGEKVGNVGGVWEMMGRVKEMKGEGMWSLWKGQLTTFILDTMTSNLQPLIQTIIHPLAPNAHPYSRSILFLTVSSHLITTVILSPFDFIRTRLIVQSSQSSHRKYSGPLDALDKVVKEEGGWKRFWEGDVWSTTLLEGTVRPFIHFVGPLLIYKWIGAEREHSPFIWGIGELGISTLGLALTLPLETIRKRSQVRTKYSQNPQKEFKTLVQVRQQQGNGGGSLKGNEDEGVLKMLYSSIKEDGWRSLFYGFEIGVVTNVVVFVLGLVAKEGVGSGNGGGNGWAEI